MIVRRHVSEIEKRLKASWWSLQICADAAGSGIHEVHMQRERSVKIKLKIKKTYFENKNNTILKIKDLAAKMKWFSRKN